MKHNNIFIRILLRIFYIINDYILINVRNKKIRFYGPNFPQVYMANFQLGSPISKELGILKSKLDRKNKITIFDIGGNIGWMALKFYDILDVENIDYVLVEPIPENQEYIIKNLKKFNYKLIKKGISNDKKFIELGINDFNGEINIKDTGLYSSKGSIDKVNIPCVKIDDLVDEKTKIDLIKIDIEGMELEALKSAEITLKRSKDIILFFEINKKIIDDFKLISSFLKELGFVNLNPERNNLIKFDSIWYKE
jgi:FkbM family methyltransferase